MPYDVIGLQPIGGQGKAGNSPQLWSYRTLDASTVVDTAGYFNPAAGLLRIGDVILVTTVTGTLAVPTGITSAGWHIVNSITAAGVVDVTDPLALVVTDTR
jgi:hypothetical protein